MKSFLTIQNFAVEFKYHFFYGGLKWQKKEKIILDLVGLLALFYAFS